jgi:hypothetical protein
MPVSLAEVISSITMPPDNSRTLRSAIEALAPTTPWITEVSVVSRVITSAVITRSKKAGLMPATWLKTAVRRSAITRSPSRLTR